MAYEANLYAAFSGRPAYQMHLYVRREAVSGNNSSYYWALLAEKVAAGTAWAGNPQAWGVNIGGVNYQGSHHLDFRSTNEIVMGYGWTGWFAHNSAGELWLSIGATIDASGELFGVATNSGVFYTDQLGGIPPAPDPWDLTQITASSMVYRFNSTGDGGSPIIRWEFQYSTSPTFSSGNSGLITSSGTSTVTGLAPSTTYYFRSRGVNAYGNGAWSSTISASTASGILVGRAGVAAFGGAPVYVGVSGEFKLAELRVGHGGSFITPAAP